MSTLSKSEQKACLSTSPPPPCPSNSQQKPRHDDNGRVNGDSESTTAAMQPQQSLRNRAPAMRRSYTAPAVYQMGGSGGGGKGQHSRVQQRQRPDYVLVFCYMVLYCEIAWLIMILLRSNSRH